MDPRRIRRCWSLHLQILFGHDFMSSKRLQQLAQVLGYRA